MQKTNLTIPEIELELLWEKALKTTDKELKRREMEKEHEKPERND